MYPQVFGKYILERELGRGGMARILLATLRGAGGFEKKLVVKQIRDELLVDSEFVRRFVEEAKTTVALSHPNIVPVYELGAEQGTYFLAMELVEGLSLDQLLRHEAKGGERNQLFPEEGAYIGVEVCRALDYAHRRMKVVHRDITPRNVMIDEEGQVKLIDFGIAAPARAAGFEVFGSPGHMPPEQVQGRELGPSTDIFAVAVLLMEAWSGHAPFRRKTMEECEAAMKAPHPRPSDADPRLIPLDDAVLRAMSLDPKARQQDADELSRSFRNFLSGVDVADVARTLGARVLHARKILNDERESIPRVESAARSPSPSQAEVMTRTFAARDEVDKWSQPPSEDMDPDAPSTRKIPSSIPPFRSDSPGELDSDAHNGKHAKGHDPFATPAAFDVKTGPRSSQKIAPNPDKKPAVEFAVETIATRPIETPVRVGASMAPRARAAGRRGMLQGALGVGVAAVAIWFFVVRPKAGATDTQNLQTGIDSGLALVLSAVTSSPIASVSSAPTLITSATSPSANPSVTAPSTTKSNTAQVTPPPSSSSTQPPGGNSATAANGTKAHLLLYGTPGTRVIVDGGAARACPSRIFVEAGSHDIRFLFDQTGESRGERLFLKPNENVTLRADFTQATPTISIQR